MSSAQNHRARSHRSAMSNRATFGTINRKAEYRNARYIQKKTIGQHLAAFFSSIRKPKESKIDRV